MHLAHKFYVCELVTLYIYIIQEYLFVFPCRNLGLGWKVSKKMKYHKGYKSFVFTFASEYEEFKSRSFLCVVRILSVETKSQQDWHSTLGCP